MTRTDLLNELIKRNSLEFYLEIGVQNPANNFDKINTPYKISVDPDVNAKANFVCTSDAFFSIWKSAAHPPGNKFDLILIDGLHHAEQVEKDITNSWEVLQPGGFIVLHDCNPTEEWQQLVPRQHKVWYGDTWRAFVGFREKYRILPSLETFCIPDDCGCGIIQKMQDVKIEPGFVSTISWKEFDQDREALLNLREWI